jgi:hypothetical protein
MRALALKSFPLEAHRHYLLPVHNTGSLTRTINLWLLDICSIACGSVGFSERDLS